MGIFDRLFRRDPERLLEKGEERLAAGDNIRALHFSQDAMKAATNAAGASGAGIAERARDLEARAREALMTNALDKAARSKDAGFPAEAADWLDIAVEHCRNEDQRKEMDALRQRLREQAEQENEITPEARKRAEEGAKRGSADPFGSAGGEGVPTPGADLEEAAVGSEDLAAYETLVDMMNDAMGEHYAGRPEAFQRAVVAFNGGEVDEALELFDGLYELQPQDPIVRFERSRCLLAKDRLEEAAAELEAVWEDLGTEALDRAGQISVPLLWAEARLGLEQYDEVAERLAPVATLERRDEGLMEAYASALVKLEEPKQALAYLGPVIDYSGRPVFRHLAAQALIQADQRRQAADLLEEVIAPACRAGCSRDALYRPAARTLIGLYMAEDKALDRAGEVAQILVNLAGPTLQKEDAEILVAYFDRSGKTEAAADLRRQLEAAS